MKDVLTPYQLDMQKLEQENKQALDEIITYINGWLVYNYSADVSEYEIDMLESDVCEYFRQPKFSQLYYPIKESLKKGYWNPSFAIDENENTYIIYLRRR